MICIVGVGMTMIIILGDIDLSPGSVMAFVGVMGATVYKNDSKSFLTLVFSLAIGAGVGFVNGFITAKAESQRLLQHWRRCRFSAEYLFIYTLIRAMRALGKI